MSWNHEKFKVFEMADTLVAQVYGATSSFPPEERYALQSQIRRAAISVPSNIVEGATRRTVKEFAQFLSIALGSASETRCLIGLAGRLGFIENEQVEVCTAQYTALVRSLQKLSAACAEVPTGHRTPDTGY
jgi:four helix bundle protein